MFLQDVQYFEAGAPGRIALLRSTLVVDNNARLLLTFGHQIYHTN